MSDEILENHTNRLIEAEGRIFALTYIVDQLLTLVEHPDAIKTQPRISSALAEEQDWLDGERSPVDPGTGPKAKGK